MDPPLINETSFSAANPSSYTLAGIWPLSSSVTGGEGPGRNGGGAGGLGMRMGGPVFGELDGSAEESTVSGQSVGNGNGGKKRRDLSSEDESSKLVSTTSTGGNRDLNDANAKRLKVQGNTSENNHAPAEVDAGSGSNKKSPEKSKSSEPPKDYIHVRARRGQATDSHSLAERARREKISERMKLLQDLVPGCNKVIGKALVLDEIINYIQSLQCQVEFLSMKLEAVNSRANIHPTIEGFHQKELGAQPFDATGMMFAPQATREYSQGPQSQWLHMQVVGSFKRAS